MQACLKRLLPQSMYWVADSIANITELRVRLGKKLVVYSYLSRNMLDYIPTHTDIDYILKVASGYSLYSIEDTLCKGYIVCEGGVRIGVAGEGVLKSGRLVTLKNISSLVIRVPSEIGHIPDEVQPILDDFGNTIILSPPYCGKTTLLRNIVKCLSNSGEQVLLIDERGEIGASVGGQCMLDIGECTDVLTGMAKADCYAGGVRTLSPSIVATDEVFGRQEVDSLVDLARCGVRFVATLHGEDIDQVLSAPDYSPLSKVVDNYILLSCHPTVGNVEEIRVHCLH